MSRLDRAPRVTIGMPTYNRAELIVQSVAMVLAQTFGDFELIICDDGSSDDTLLRLKAITDPRVTVLTFANRGPPHPLNEILQRARGEYLIILHDHDIFRPDLIASCVAALDSQPKAHFVVPGSAWVAEDGVSCYRPIKLSLAEINDGPRFAREIISRGENLEFPVHACCMIRCSSFAATGNTFPEAAGWYADIAVTFSLLALGPFAYLEAELLRFRTRDSAHTLTRNFGLTYHTLFPIFEVQTQRFFADDSAARAKHLRRFRAMRGRFISRTLVQTLAVGDSTSFRSALLVARDDLPQAWRRHLAAGLAGCPWLHPALCLAGVQLNHARKLMRR